jgi:hypothetical protein
MKLIDNPAVLVGQFGGAAQIVRKRNVIAHEAEIQIARMDTQLWRRVVM